MKIRLLPSTFDSDGCAAPGQRLSCYIVDERVAIDAGSIALSDDAQRAGIRDIIVTHPHMDHIATLPVFIDDLFSSLTEPVRVYATEEVIRLLERDVFNWTVYPRFSELSNDRTRVMEYRAIRPHETFSVAHLRVTPIPVTHVVPTVGLIVTDGAATVAFSSDTSATEEFWEAVNAEPRLDALLVEASFPDAMRELAEVSGHLTPSKLRRELDKLTHTDLDILAVHLKPSFRAQVVEELRALAVKNLRVMEQGRDYVW